MLEEYPSIHLHLGWIPDEPILRINRAQGMIFRTHSGDVQVLAKRVLDATEMGDLLPMFGAEHSLGAESRLQTGEPDAPASAKPEWIQPITVPLAVELRPRGEDHRIPMPPNYAHWRQVQNYHVLDGAMDGMFDTPSAWWTYRRVLAAGRFRDPRIPCDVSMINTPSNDYMGGAVPSEDPERDALHMRQAREVSLGYLYWLQNECPRHDSAGEYGYPELRLRADWFDTEDGLPPQPYVRESRRILAHTVLLQQQLAKCDFSGAALNSGVRAEPFADACAIGHYWLDIHRGAGGEEARLAETLPFQIPLGALVPRRLRSLLAAGKCLGATHLANGAVRLHPIEWAVGEAAGTLAAYCVQHRLEALEVLEEKSHIHSVQDMLLYHGAPLFWWCDLTSEDKCFAAANRLALRGVWPVEEEPLEFRAAELPSPALRHRLMETTGVRLPHDADRGAVAQILDRELHNRSAAASPQG
jgi:hypothetical protein